MVRREEEPKFTEEGPDTRRLNPSELMSLAAQTDPGQPDPPDAITVQHSVQDSATTEQVAMALGFGGESSPGQDPITLQSALPATQPPGPAQNPFSLPESGSAQSLFGGPPLSAAPSQAPLSAPSQAPLPTPSLAPQSAPSHAPLSAPSQAPDLPAPSFPSWSTSATVAPDPSKISAPPAPLPSVDDAFDFPPPAYTPASTESPELEGDGFEFGAPPFSDASADEVSNAFPPPPPPSGPHAFPPPPPPPPSGPDAFAPPSGSHETPVPGTSSANPFELPVMDSSMAPPLETSPNPASSPFAAPLDGLGNSSDIPGLLPPDAVSGGDPFADDGFEASADDSSGEAWAQPDFPSASAPDSLVPAPVPVARIHLGPAGLPEDEDRWSQGETTAIAAAYVPESLAPTPVPQELPVVGDHGGLWPSLVGAILGVAVVLTFLPEVGQGILDTFTRRGADALVRVSQTRVLADSLPNLRALDTHVSVYRIASGEQVLVVRGVARNLGKTPARGLSAVALAMNGDTVVARATAAVGVLLSPDVLAKLEAPSEVSMAYAQRAASAAQDEVKPGAELPFMVVFPEMPKQPEDRVFLVEFLSFAP